MAPHPSTLAWKIPGMGEPGGLLSMGRTELDMTEATQQQQGTIDKENQEILGDHCKLTIAQESNQNIVE